MKIFISWSGDKSRAVALALRGWLPFVIQSVELFTSVRDIRGGLRWRTEIATQLAATNFGVVCVTRDNQGSAWLNFEAGALAKSLEESRVVPLAIDLEPGDVRDPLGEFQALPATQEGFSELVESINAASESPLSPDFLHEVFGEQWPKLEAQLSAINQRFGGHSVVVPSDELLHEALSVVRTLAGLGEHYAPDAPLATQTDAGSRYPFHALGKLSAILGREIAKARGEATWNTRVWLTKPFTLYIETTYPLRHEAKKELKQIAATDGLRVVFSYFRAGILQ